MFLDGYRHHLYLHSFPTRRSSDLANREESVQPSLKTDEERSSRGAQDQGAQYRIAPASMESVPDFKLDRKSTRLNSSHANTSYAVFCWKKKNRAERRRAAYAASRI